VVTVKRLSDRYEIESQIAAGGMGIVYRARDLRLGRAVALKILKDHLSHDDRFVERFRREARAVASLSHPNIASLFDYGEDEGRHYIVMECVDGDNLAAVLEKEGQIAPSRAAAIARDVCSALAVAHASGIVHRDVKPANVLLTRDGVVKVTDFGIARAAGDSTLTATGSILGTAHYLAPEQAAGEPASPATDVYATGVVLFEMLTGSVPFSGESPIAVATQHLNDELPSPRSIDPAIPTELEAVVRTATAKRSADRYSDATEMGNALGAAELAGVPASHAAAAATAEISGPATSTAPLPTLTRRVRSWKPPRLPQGLRGRRLGMMVLLGLSAIVLALLAFRLAEGPARDTTPVRGDAPSQRTDDAETQPEPSMVVVPAVEGLPIDEALASLDRAGLAAATEGDGQGIVIEAQPPGGAEATQGSTVTLTVVASDDEDEESDEGPPGHAEGRGKDKKDKAKDKDKDREEDD
jgi:serine/threonine-protein kinase